MQGRSVSRREQRPCSALIGCPGSGAPYFALTSGDSDSVWRSDSAMAASRSALRSHGVGLEASYWHAGVGHSASKYLQRGHHCSIVSLWSQEPGFDRRRHLAWVGEEDAGEVPCGAHSAWMAAVQAAGVTQFGLSLSASALPSLCSPGPRPSSLPQAGRDECGEPPQHASCVACLGLGYAAHWRHGLRQWEG